MVYYVRVSQRQISPSPSLFVCSRFLSSFCLVPLRFSHPFSHQRISQRNFMITYTGVCLCVVFHLYFVPTRKCPSFVNICFMSLFLFHYIDYVSFFSSFYFLSSHLSSSVNFFSSILQCFMYIFCVISFFE